MKKTIVHSASALVILAMTTVSWTAGAVQEASPSSAETKAMGRTNETTVKWIDISKIYSSNGGERFASVVLDPRSGVPTKNGAYRLAETNEMTDSIAAAAFVVISQKCSEATAILDRGGKEDVRLAFNGFSSAYALLPQPREKWHATAWILSRMGECYFRAGSFQQAKELFSDLMGCPGTIGNPWLHLRHGEVSFETGDLRRAADELIRAYMGGGKEIFAKEDKKYYEFLKTKAKGLEQ